jgi:outer membrane protein TolC
MNSAKRYLIILCCIALNNSMMLSAQCEYEESCFAYGDPEENPLIDNDQNLDAIIEEAETSLVDMEPPLELDLPMAIGFALNQNRALANAADGVLRAKLSLDLSKSAFDIKFTPSADMGLIGGGEAGFGSTIGGSLEWCKRFTFGTKVSIRPYATVDAHRHHTGVKAMIVQPLLRGFGREYTLAPVFAAKFGYRSSYRSAYLAGVDLILRITSQMYNILKQERLLEFDLAVQERQKHFYNSIKIKERIGMADSLDVYRAETELKQSEDSINNSREHLQDSYDKLREILALPLGRNIKINLSTEYSPFMADQEQALETALMNRVEIMQAHDRLKESQRLALLAKKGLMPDLDLVIDFSNIGSDEYFTNTFTNRNDSRWGFGLSTSTDWDKATQDTAFRQALLNVDNSKRSYEQAQDSVVIDVKHAIRSLKKAGLRIALQEKQIHSSEGGLRLAKIKFDRGLANNFDVIQAEKTLKQAYGLHLGALIEHKIGEYKFLAALGLLVDKPPFCQ